MSRFRRTPEPPADPPTGRNDPHPTPPPADRGPLTQADRDALPRVDRSFVNRADRSLVNRADRGTASRADRSIANRMDRGDVPPAEARLGRLREEARAGRAALRSTSEAWAALPAHEQPAPPGRFHTQPGAPGMHPTHATHSPEAAARRTASANELGADAGRADATALRAGLEREADAGRADAMALGAGDRPAGGARPGSTRPGDQPLGNGTRPGGGSGGRAGRSRAAGRVDRGDEAAPYRPLYARMLGLRHVAPSGFLCFVFLEGTVASGILLALAELVSWWGVLVLPTAVAGMVKLNDMVAGVLGRQHAAHPVRTRSSAARSGTAPHANAWSPRAELSDEWAPGERRPGDRAFGERASSVRHPDAQDLDTQSLRSRLAEAHPSETLPSVAWSADVQAPVAWAPGGWNSLPETGNGSPSAGYSRSSGRQLPVVLQQQTPTGGEGGLPHGGNIRPGGPGGLPDSGNALPGGPSGLPGVDNEARPARQWADEIDDPQQDRQSAARRYE